MGSALREPPRKMATTAKRTRDREGEGRVGDQGGER